MSQQYSHHVIFFGQEHHSHGPCAPLGRPCSLLASYLDPRCWPRLQTHVPPSPACSLDVHRRRRPSLETHAPDVELTSRRALPPPASVERAEAG
jgi:hypothetical protein